MADRIQRGMVRVKFLAIKEIIQSKLSQGYTIQLLYDELCNEGKIIGSYKSFSRYIKFYGLNKPKKTEPTTQINQSNPQQTPAQKVSFTEGASYSDLIKKTENQEENK